MWSPAYRFYVVQKQSLKKKFPVLRNSGWNSLVSLSSYKNRLPLLSLPSLEKRRFILDVSFLVKFVNGGNGSLALLRKINVNVPSRCSSPDFIFIRLDHCRYCRKMGVRLFLFGLDFFWIGFFLSGNCSVWKWGVTSHWNGKKKKEKKIFDV